jgi:hypothetical protein
VKRTVTRTSTSTGHPAVLGKYSTTSTGTIESYDVELLRKTTVEPYKVNRTQVLLLSFLEYRTFWVVGSLGLLAPTLYIFFNV